MYSGRARCRAGRPMNAGGNETAMTDLDQMDTFDRLDPTGVHRRIAAFTEDARAAWALGRAFEPPASFRAPRRVVVLGMGGSAIGADIAGTLALRRTAVPLQVVRGSAVPPVDDETLVIASSHSGETWEVLSAFEAVLAGPGMHMAITQGGRLGELCEGHGAPVARYRYDGEPRAALAYGVFLLLGVLDRLGVAVVTEDEVVAALAEVDEQGADWGTQSPVAGNLAKRLAGSLDGRLPVIVGDGPLQVAALRWQNQLNENAKRWAFHAALPELAHNLVEAFGRPSAVPFRLIVLESPFGDAHSRRRNDVILEQLAQSRVDAERVRLEARSALAALLVACHLGDWTSLYAALLDGVDPSPVPVLTRFKESLASVIGGAR
ncbi:MAG: hypothetical protein GEU80_07755 [Dehalococcoidia bacterium]|nr:hypothetical protein [Dehalococcoidia bacterium]